MKFQAVIRRQTICTVSKNANLKVFMLGEKNTKKIEDI